MITEHTPEPWNAELITQESGHEHWRIGNDDAGNSIVAEVQDYRESKSERDANARLIQYAPTMYRALKMVMDCEVDTENPSGPYIKVPAKSIFHLGAEIGQLIRVIEDND